MAVYSWAWVLPKSFFKAKTYLGKLPGPLKYDGTVNCVIILLLTFDVLQAERLPVMDFSAPYDFDSNCFLVRKPLPLPKFMSLVMPFTG